MLAIRSFNFRGNPNQGFTGAKPPSWLDMCVGYSKRKLRPPPSKNMEKFHAHGTSAICSITRVTRRLKIQKLPARPCQTHCGFAPRLSGKTSKSCLSFNFQAGLPNQGCKRLSSLRLSFHVQVKHVSLFIRVVEPAI